MRAVLLLSCLMALASAEAARVTDRAVRYVNREVVTYGDVQKRVSERREDLKRRGQVVPDETSQVREWQRFYQDALEDLTDEALLVQKAEELKVPVDRDRLAEQVLAEAKDRGLPLRLVAELRRIRERQAKADMVLGYFEDRAAGIGPDRLAMEYERRKSDFRRPTRAQVLYLALRPTPAEERQDLVKALAGTMKAAQQAQDAQIKAEAAGRLDAFLAAAPAEQQRILGELAAAIGGQADRPDLVKDDARLAADARALALRWVKVRDQAACLARVEAVRAEIAALPTERRTEAFQAIARAESQGPHAADGGALGWVEPGSYGREIEEQAFAMPAGELSEAFWTGGTAAVLLVTAREEGRQQGFDEVSALLQSTLDRERRLRIRSRVAQVLRAQASVSDVVPLTDLVK